MFITNSVAVLTNMLEDIKRIWYVTLVIVQSIFIILYSYSIYVNLDKTIFLITYSILFLLSLISFILFFINHKNKVFNRVKNNLKYIVNIVMLAVNIVEMVKFNIDDFNKILIIISAISLLVQIIVELIKIFAEKYINDFNNALKKDLEPLNILNIKRIRSNLLKLVDTPLEKIAELKTGKKKELSKDEIKLIKHKKRYKSRKRKLKEQEIFKKIEKKEKLKNQEEIRVQKEIIEIKQHFANIFTRKK